MKTETKKHLETMLFMINQYASQKISFYSFVDNLWGLYELMDASDKDDVFIDLFHKHWDFLEEIRAFNEEIEYKQKIKDEIIVELANLIKQYLNSLNPS